MTSQDTAGLAALDSADEAYRLDGKVAFVTGGASGIGFATAAVLSRQGAATVLLDIDADGAQRRAESLRATGHRAAAVGVDLADSDDIRRAFGAGLAAFGALDILVCSAGVVGSPHGVLDVPESVVETSHRVNVHANFVLSRLAGEHMIGHGVRGRVVYLSSSSAFRAEMSYPHYSTTKAALGQLARSFAAEVGRYGITVNAVAPGPTNTPMNAGGRAQLDVRVRSGPLKNLTGCAAEPEDVAEVVAFLCLPASRLITGQVIQASYGAIV
ncbi:SDR family NAD(P)-dependent oxidoreductase [Amycolatopsis sp. GM8]|uniref:SDR family NAD(P)-dependent oxidoreductase n=1 Tax=Amycolatopsis sp. GM8 TaxID=2896530 RepID=UPI001F222110|nr:SDR family oxidoreductase [Amycolatopsis sp. GM8]